MHRFLFYAYGSFGLGHLRRVLHIARGLAERDHAASILIATNSSQARAVTLPGGCSFLPLQPLIRDIFHNEPNRYRSLVPGVSVREAFELRAQAIRCALDTFRPDLVFVDHGATGAERELIPLLEAIDAKPPSEKPRLVLGLRDIYGRLDWTQKDWKRLGANEVLPLYDLVLVFGDQQVLTTAQELRLATKLPGKVHHTGYLGRRINLEAHQDQGQADRPTILVTAGGGNDGQPFLERLAEFLEGSSGPNPFRFQVVTGPFLSRRVHNDLKRRYLSIDNSVQVMGSTKRMDQLLEGASGVISMGGYNTMVEIASARKPGLVMPRKSPSEEQVLRAQRLCPPAGLSYCLPGQPMLQAINSFLDRVRDEPKGFQTSRADLSGLDRTVARINSLAKPNQTT